jgi:hypothetical protein
VPSNPSSESATLSSGSFPTTPEPFTVTGSPALSVDDISSTMASSSTETLQSTLNLPTIPGTAQPPDACHPPSFHVPDGRIPSNDLPFSQDIQPQRQANTSKLSVQLDINNAISKGQATSRVSQPNPELARRVTSHIYRRDPAVLEASRKVTVEDGSSSSGSSSSSVIEESARAGAPPSRPLPSIPETLQDRYGRIESRKFHSDKESAAENGDRVNPRDAIGLSSKSLEPRFRTRAASTNSMPLLQKVEFPRRSVRWTEELVCPSPLPRRIGWFNRRG